ncbi:MAG: hypothetical protein Ct9H300mP1_18050 [Planctomycetaceae bacterium]|nr:MAG: hypothetical protein Ct9H300mP1_18050 [Planctomycetaceae bacterium]
MRIVLIGYRGSGKSVVGRLVANRLNLALSSTPTSKLKPVTADRSQRFLPKTARWDSGAGNGM